MSEIILLDSIQHREILSKSSCAFGVFDGIHLGHSFIIEKACEYAHEKRVSSGIITFSIDPDELFHPKRLHKLMSNEERIEGLACTGVDFVAVLPFTRSFAALSSEQFLIETFLPFIPKALHVGCDIHFGAHARGDVNDMQKWGKRHGMDVFGYGLICKKGGPITSTRIRLLLEEGNEEEAKIFYKDNT